MAADESDRRIYQVQTVPPPPGETDAYSAPTKVGAMANAIVTEMIEQARRRAEEAGPPETAEETAASASPSSPPPRSAPPPSGAVTAPPPAPAEMPTATTTPDAIDVSAIKTAALPKFGFDEYDSASPIKTWEASAARVESSPIAPVLVAPSPDARLDPLPLPPRVPSPPAMHVPREAPVATAKSGSAVFLVVLMLTLLAFGAAGYFLFFKRRH